MNDHSNQANVEEENNVLNSTVQPKTVVDMTNLTGGESKLNILPSAILAANMFNMTNKLGSIEVELPIMNIKVVVNPISSMSELEAKTISGSIHVYMEKNLRLFYDHTEFPPEAGINSFETFLEKMTDTDFKVIAYALTKASFKTLQESSFICSNEKCSNPDKERIFKFTISTQNLDIHFPRAPFDSPSKDHTKDLFIDEMGNLKINYKFDCLRDKFNILSAKTNEDIRHNLSTIRTLMPRIELIKLFIDSVEITNPQDGTVIKLTSQDEIVVFLSKLNTSSKELINASTTKYINHLMGWTPTFSTDLICPHCKNKTVWEDIDLIVEFFLKLSTVY